MGMRVDLLAKVGSPIVVNKNAGTYLATAGVQRLTITNVSGPFEPAPDAPAARLERGPGGTVRIVVDMPTDIAGVWIGPMANGMFAHAYDSRFGAAVERLLGHPFYGAVSVHDRYDTQAVHRQLSV